MCSAAAVQSAYPPSPRDREPLGQESSCGQRWREGAAVGQPFAGFPLAERSPWLARLMSLRCRWMAESKERGCAEALRTFPAGRWFLRAETSRWKWVYPFSGVFYVIGETASRNPDCVCVVQEGAWPCSSALPCGRSICISAHKDFSTSRRGEKLISVMFSSYTSVWALVNGTALGKTELKLLWCWTCECACAHKDSVQLIGFAYSKVILNVPKQGTFCPPALTIKTICEIAPEGTWRRSVLYSNFYSVGCCSG